MSIRFLGYCLLLSLLSGPARSATLRVGVAGTPPFVMLNKIGQPVGFCVDVWQTTAGQEALAYQFVHVATKEEALTQLQAGTLDVVVGDISITSDRVALMDFTVPFYHTTRGIVTRIQELSIWERLELMLTGDAAWIVGVFFCVLFCLGNLLWLAERGTNPGVPNSYRAGVAEGMWLALVTITTVGYGDRVPRTRWGRCLMGFCMLVATVGVSSMTATIASKLTLSGVAPGLNSEHDLAGHRVAVLAGTPDIEFVRRYGARPMIVKTQDQALSAVLANQADAAVAEYPALSYALAQQPDVPLRVYKSAGTLQDYGFVFARGNPLVYRFNITLLRLREQGRFQAIEQAWLSDEPGQS